MIMLYHNYQLVGWAYMLVIWKFKLHSVQMTRVCFKRIITIGKHWTEGEEEGQQEHKEQVMWQDQD